MAETPQSRRRIAAGASRQAPSAHRTSGRAAAVPETPSRTARGSRPHQGAVPRRAVEKQKVRSARRRAARFILMVLAVIAVVLVAPRLVEGASTLVRSLGGLFQPVAPVVQRPDAPRLEGGPEIHVRVRRVEVAGRVSSSVPGRHDHRIRLYVDGRRAREIAVGEDARFTFTDVPIGTGTTVIAAAVASSAGEGERSDPLRVVFDDRDPPVSLSAPVEGGLVNGDTVLVKGQTEPLATVTVKNITASAEATGNAARTGGAFEVRVPLAAGVNDLRVSARDRAGNTASRPLRVLRGAGRITATLILSRARIPIRSLPATIDITARLVDADGRPVNGAQLTFTLSPPGLPTSTFHAVTRDGTAVWRDVVIQGAGALVGNGFATVLGRLPDGQEVRATVPFTIVERD